MKCNNGNKAVGFISDERGYSLSEMIVVLVIMSVITTIPVMMIASAKVDFSRQTFVRELKSSLERARFDSIKRKPETKEAMSKVVVSPGSFQLVTYKNSAGNIDSTGVAQAQKVETKAIEAANGSILAHSASGIGSAFPVTIAFDERGEIIATDSNNNVISNVAFVICEANCSAPTSENSTVLMISPTGTVAVLTGGSDLNTYIAPASTASVSQGSGINKLVTIPSN